MATDRFAGPVIAALKKDKSTAAVNRAIAFLEKRLTDAAKGGCHHCDEGDKGSPCWWCGLKNGRSI